MLGTPSKMNNEDAWVGMPFTTSQSGTFGTPTLHTAEEGDFQRWYAPTERTLEERFGKETQLQSDTSDTECADPPKESNEEPAARTPSVRYHRSNVSLRESRKLSGLSRILNSRQPKDIAEVLRSLLELKEREKERMEGRRRGRAPDPDDEAPLSPFQPGIPPAQQQAVGLQRGWTWRGLFKQMMPTHWTSTFPQASHSSYLENPVVVLLVRARVALSDLVIGVLLNAREKLYAHEIFWRWVEQFPRTFLGRQHAKNVFTALYQIERALDVAAGLVHTSSAALGSFVEESDMDRLRRLVHEITDTNNQLLSTLLHNSREELGRVSRSWWAPAPADAQHHQQQQQQQQHQQTPPARRARQAKPQGADAKRRASQQQQQQKPGFSANQAGSKPQRAERAKRKSFNLLPDEVLHRSHNLRRQVIDLAGVRPSPRKQASHSMPYPSSSTRLASAFPVRDMPLFTHSINVRPEPPAAAQKDAAADDSSLLDDGGDLIWEQTAATADGLDDTAPVDAGARTPGEAGDEERKSSLKAVQPPRMISRVPSTVSDEGSVPGAASPLVDGPPAPRTRDEPPSDTRIISDMLRELDRATKLCANILKATDALYTGYYMSQAATVCCYVGTVAVMMAWLHYSGRGIQLAEWWSKTKAACVDFIKDHVIEPLHGISNELLLRQSDIMNRETARDALKQGNASLQKMLIDFITQVSPHHKEALAVISRGEVHNPVAWKPVIDILEEQIKYPIFNAARGEVGRALMLEAIKTMVVIDQQTVEVDLVLRANRLNINALATIPAFGMLWVLTSSYQYLANRFSKRLPIDNPFIKITLSLREIHLLFAKFETSGPPQVLQSQRDFDGYLAWLEQNGRVLNALSMLERSAASVNMRIELKRALAEDIESLKMMHATDDMRLAEVDRIWRTYQAWVLNNF
ncbi:Protein DGS1 [Diplonema papillatum]|nr:Protein DGS1 [Diplonema papillatum]